jgi:hypothetical protein
MNNHRILEQPAEGNYMLRKLLICLFIALLSLTLSGCSLITGEGVSEPTEKDIRVTTEFGRMLGYVPSSLIEEHDVWFSNPGVIKAQQGLEDIGSIREYMELPEETREQKIGFFSGTGLSSLPIAHYPDIYDMIGFDVMTIDRALYGNIIPPRGFYILEGDFDETLICQKLTEQGYTKTDYGQHSYYGIRDDFEMDLRHPLGLMVLASMNRVVVQDGLIITSPVTADISGIFDTMDGNSPSVLDNEMCLALAESMGDVLTATITTPERIIFTDLAGHQESPMMFDFTIPANWGTLRGYEMAALGYCADGENHHIDIALYYDDKIAAEADGQEIVKRIQSYEVGTYMGGTQQLDEPIMFTDWWQPGEPVVREYGEGVVLKITCHPVSGIPRWVSTFLGSSGMPFRDLLFLAPDPSEYIGENEPALVIYEENKN